MFRGEAESCPQGFECRARELVSLAMGLFNCSHARGERQPSEPLDPSLHLNHCQLMVDLVSSTTPLPPGSMSFHL